MMLKRKLRREVGIQSEAGFPQLGMNHYLPYLETMHSELKPDVYFEIGTESGASLGFAHCTAIAVDPVFRLDTDVAKHKPELHLYQGTSDAFFESGLLDRLGLAIDFAFLDGMHLFEFLLRDFINTERHMSQDGVIVMHDCVPFNALVAERDWDREKTASWTGDVWKLIPILREYRTDLKIEVLDLAPTGLVKVSSLDPDNKVLSENYDEIIERFSDQSLSDFGLKAFNDCIQLKPVHAPSGGGAPAKKRNGVIGLKISVPDDSEKLKWGDYYFARSLARAFKRLGHKTRIDFVSDWNNAPNDDLLDLSIQGRRVYPVRDAVPALAWLIYPRKNFAPESLRSYAHSFVASDLFLERIMTASPDLSASVLYQAFDREVMCYGTSSPNTGLVFVGNNHLSRFRDRPMARFARASGCNLKIWGTGWDPEIWGRYLQDGLVENEQLGKLYSNAMAVLNDHNPVMAKNGFLSNRVFDVLACGTPVISDMVPQMPAGFEQFVEVASTQEEFDASVDRILSGTGPTNVMRQDFAQNMRGEHSFDSRAREILQQAEALSLI